MDKYEPVFVIPTHRLRDVGETVEAYDQHFHDNGHKIPIWVFDDSSEAAHKRYFKKLRSTPTFNEVYIIGPEEKAKFVDHIVRSTGTTLADSLIYRIFKTPSYGGNRNFILAYTLGRRVMSSDDDMRPGGYVINPENNGSVLGEDEVMKGETVSDLSLATWKEYDLYDAFFDILGKSPDSLGFRIGEYMEDPNYNLTTNSVVSWGGNINPKTTMGLKPLVSPIENTRIRIAQSYRTGTSDLDAIELFRLFLHSDATDIVNLKNYFVLEGFQPVVTRRNWRFDCGVSGYDNATGLPPFFPTSLRFEDYPFRIWSSKNDGVASAHVNAVQHHTRSTFMRPPLTAEIFNEVIANFLKTKIEGSIRSVGDVNFTYDYDGVIKENEVEEILNRVRELDASVQRYKEQERNPHRKENLNEYRYNLRSLFSDYDHDRFLSGFSSRIDDENWAIRDTMLYWERILEISSWHATRHGLPMKKVANKRK